MGRQIPTRALCTLQSRTFAVALFIALGSVAAALVYRNLSVIPAEPRPRPTGDELVVILVGSPACPAASDPHFPDRFEQIVAHLSERAGDHDVRLVTIGIGTGASPERSMEFLTSVGRFDEMMVGRGWLNSGALRYLWRDLPGKPSIPQIIVTHRSLDMGPFGASVVVGPEILLARKVGLPEIYRWEEIGAPIPNLPRGWIERGRGDFPRTVCSTFNLSLRPRTDPPSPTRRAPAPPRLPPGFPRAAPASPRSPPADDNTASAPAAWRC